jgi:hypothetical protein
MANLRAQVENQQKGIIGNDGNLQKHIDQTKENYKSQVLAKASKLANDCLAAYNSYSKMISQQKEAYEKVQSEIGEKVPTFCKKFNEARDGHPNGACSGNVGDLTKAAFKAAAQTGDRSANASIAEFEVMCDGFNNEDKNDNKKASNPVAMCKDLKDGEGLETCEQYKMAFKLSGGAGTEEERKKYCWATVESKVKEEDGSFTTTQKPGIDCAKRIDFLTKQITFIYEDKFDPNASKLDLRLNSSAPAFCNAADNSGQQNTKGNLGAFGSILGGIQQGANAVGN